MRKTIAVVLFVAILLVASGSAMAQCRLGRIGGCPINNIGSLMYGNMRLINGAGYGYPSYVGFYQNGNFMRVGVINGILRVIETLDVTRAQTQQAQILAQVANQMQVEVPQQQPQQQGTFALNYGPPTQQQPQPVVYQQQSAAAPNMPASMLATWGSQDQNQQEPRYPMTNRSEFRVRLTFVDGAVIYLERDRSIKLTQPEIDRIAGIDALVAQQSGVVEYATKFVPTEDFNGFHIIAPIMGDGKGR
jgi:hypothetical protein